MHCKHVRVASVIIGVIVLLCLTLQPLFQELKVAFARSRKVAVMQAEALMSLGISLAMCR
jgi:hypothetical protein